MFGGIWKFLFGNESYFLSAEMLEIRWSSGPGRDVEVCSNRKNKMAERALRRNEKRGIRCVTSLILIAPPARNSG